MSKRAMLTLGWLLAAAVSLFVDDTATPSSTRRKERVTTFDRATRTNALTMIDDGQATFRLDRFGDEEFWGDALKLHEATEGPSLGGPGPGVSPRMALGVGLKVEAESLPRTLRGQLRNGQVNLVIDHYDGVFRLGLARQEQDALVEFLKLP